ncbi:MAG: iron-containing alcohol dehydrogenase [Thermodesulfobacteriota bacterium]
MIASRPFRVPPTIHFGQNASAETGPEAKRLKATKALVFTDKVLMSGGIVQPIIDSLEKAGVGVEIYDGIDAEPTLAHVQKGLELFRKKGCDILVAAGGGSPIDAAKAVSVMCTNPGKIQDYIGLGKISTPGVPLIAIPTTAGTGSEATVYTIITDTEKDVKMLIGSPVIMPAAAIVDPLLTLKMPRSITAATGLDALIHAIEAYVSVKAQPMSDVFCLSAIRLLSEFLPQAWANPDNVEARSQTMLGALQAGIAFSNASVALVHGMSRPIGANFHVAHGISNAALLGVVMEFSLIGAPRRYADIAQAMGVCIDGLPALEGARRGAEAVQTLVKQLEVPSLTALGVGREKLEPLVSKMADDAIASGSPGNNPRRATREEIINLYYAAL